MKNLLYIFTITLLTSCSNTTDKNKGHISNEQTKTTNELEYLNVRNSFIQYFKNKFENNPDYTDEIVKQDSDSLLVLENMLRVILKNSRIDSVLKFGKINLETFIPELGFGNLDGLVLNNNSSLIFVTSKVLFFDYFKSQKIYSFNNLSSKQLGGIFSSLISEAHSTVFYSEGFSTNNNSQVYGCIGTIAQDIERFPPDNIFVLLANGDYIYIVQKYLDQPIIEISKCQAIYDSIYTNSQKHFDEYKASNLTDKKAIEKSFELEETAWNKYCECYQENFRTNNQFNRLRKEIEKIVKYVEQ